MAVTTRIITDFNELLDIENIWNNELVASAENPLLYSQIFVGFMRLCEKQSWTPLVITFWANNRIVGMAPLKRLKSFYSNHVYSLAEDVYSDFVFLDEYREQCMKQLLKVLFDNLNCRSANITFDTASPNLRLFEKNCRDRKLSFREKPNFGRGIIPVETSYDLYYNSLKNNIRKEFRKIKRKLDRLGSWKISCTGINPESIKRILAVDQKSWKAAWRAKNNLKEDAVLRIILEASQPNGEVEPLYESKVWFLDVDGVAIAYQLVLFYKGTAVFIKTSFNAHFKRFSPSKFLINSAIREVFRKETVNKIDFVTNLPFIKAWKSLCEHRTRVIMEVNPFLSRVIRVVLRNPLMRKVVK